ncbi:Transcriptional regulator, AraC family [Labilithrix luteola]|uniref:Transcriptional regulator, AraC family n=1 Tax=Labilithrix luteola TaxID=1391654 RepID=A0A0K1PJW4_9BACT|nr:AraC family transcriptional regulator [Labilithrix luteola]AKU93810.1 Transcriptional regulator, AraC family [Labilithrix luteola]
MTARKILPDSMRGGVKLRRELLASSEGFVALSHRFEGEGRRVIVTHDASLLALVEVQRGRAVFPLPSGPLDAPSRFVLSLPPRTVLPLHFFGAVLTSRGMARFGTFATERPALLDATGIRDLTDVRDARVAARAPCLSCLDADRRVPRHVVAARLRLHDLLARPAPIREAARVAGIAPETLTRAFQEAYGITPKQYVHKARLFVAVLRLLSGKAIVETALDAGFNDVTRFYAQFRRLLGATPGVYASIKKRQDGARRSVP